MIMHTLKRAAAVAFIVACVGTPARAGESQVRVPSSVSVEVAVSRMTSAVEKAGARVFAVINYTKGNASVGENIRPTVLVIFGSPKIGASALTVGQTMGLYLPLRVLAFEDETGKVWLTYTKPADAAEEHGIPRDHPAIVRMGQALVKFTEIAANP